LQVLWGSVHLNRTKLGWPYSPVMSPGLFIWTLFQINPPAFHSSDVSKYLDAVFKNGSVQEHLTGLGVTWQFNVEQTPWWGGAFERMVRSTNLCLRKLIGRAHFYSTVRN